MIQMIFELTEEQLEFQKSMREFALKELAPGALQRDIDGDFSEVYDILMNKMGSKGLLGLTFPKEYGGLGKSYMEFALGMFELCRIDVSVGASWSVCLSLGTIPLYRFGTEEQKQKYLVPLARGEKLCAFGLTEREAGSDVSVMKTTAVRSGDKYIINGHKIYITNAGYADTYIIFAKTDESKGSRGISAFILEKGTPRFSFGEEYNKMGIRSSIQRELIFEDVCVPVENRIGEEGEGFKIAMTALDVGRLGVAAQGVGAAWGAYDIALEHAKNRVQFGKPITANQAVSFKLAEMATSIELSKLITLKAAYLLSKGLPFSKEVAMAKLVATDTAMKVTTEAVQILGEKGYLVENQAERFMRNAKILQIFEGTNEIQKLVISGYILQDIYLKNNIIKSIVTVQLLWTQSLFA